MKPSEVDGIVYDKQRVSGLRDALIRSRQAAVLTGDIGSVITLSHLIALLATVIEELES